MGVSGINPNRRHFPSNMPYTLAARIQGKPKAEAPSPDATKKAEADKPAAEIKAIVIADLDMISEQFFEIRKRKIDNLDFDNIPFVLNCVDVLAGDDAYISLRKRRPQHRTLERLEKQTRDYVLAAQDEAKQAEDEAKDALDRAQKSLDEKVRKIRDDKELDDRSREIKLLEPWRRSRTAASKSRRPPSRTRSDVGSRNPRPIASKRSARSSVESATWRSSEPLCRRSCSRG